jgi:TolB-like protein
MQANVIKTSMVMACLSALLLPIVSGCATTNTDLNARTVVQYNYRGADDVVNQVERYASGPGSILITSLANVDRLDTSSRFGRISADEIGSRLSQRGFRVLEARLRDTFVVSSNGTFMLSDQIKLIGQQQKAASVLVGTYADSGSQALVSIKLIRIADGAIIGSSDYVVPMDTEVHGALLSDDSHDLGALWDRGGTTAWPPQAPLGIGGSGEPQ